jgi:hypothetical protein
MWQSRLLYNCSRKADYPPLGAQVWAYSLSTSAHLFAFWWDNRLMCVSNRHTGYAYICVAEWRNRQWDMSRRTNKFNRNIKY